MEYIVSNIAIPGSAQVSSHLWICGKELIKSENYLYLLDGYIIDYQIKGITEYLNLGIENHYANGAYNIFCFDNRNGQLEIKTDKRATLPLYKYEKDGVFAFSNSPWLLVKHFYDNISICEESLKSMLLYFADCHPTRTLFTNISRVDGATYIRFDTIRNLKETRRYWDFTWQPDTSLDLNSLLEKADADFTFYFRTIKEQNEEGIAGFGCSGGLDSRLIAHYIHKTGIRCQPYVIVDEKPHGILKSVTVKSSRIVAETYGLKVNIVPYRAEWIEQSMILDIRNHPFAYSQAYINPIDDIPDFDYMFVGDPGGLAYMADYILSGDPVKLKKHADFFIGYSRWGMTGIWDIMRKVAGHLNISFDPYRESGWFGLRRSAINRVIDHHVKKDCREELFALVDGFGGENNIEKWMHIYDRIISKYMYSAAYGSMCHTKKSYQLYYPFFYETLASFPLDYFRDKFFLKKMIGFVNPAFLKIPDQNLNLIGGVHGFTDKLCNRIELALRGRGLNFLHLLHEHEYRQFARIIFMRDNPIFYTIVDKKQLFRSGLLESYAGINYLKLKMMTDIFYYREFDNILSKQRYIKCEW